MLQKILPAAGIVVFILLSGTVSEISSIVLNIKSNLIILTGAFVCSMVSYPFRLFSDLFVNIRKAFSGEKTDLDALIKQIEVMAAIRRRDGKSSRGCAIDGRCPASTTHYRTQQIPPETSFDPRRKMIRCCARLTGPPARSSSAIPVRQIARCFASASNRQNPLRKIATPPTAKKRSSRL